MRKIRIIAEREYLSRVKKLQFILITLGAPILFGLFFLVVGFIFSYSGDEKRTILISDPSNILEERFEASTITEATFRQGTTAELLKIKEEEGFDGVLLVPAVDSAMVRDINLRYISEQRLDIDTDLNITGYFNSRMREWKIKQLGIDEDLLASLNTRVRISSSTDLVAAASESEDDAVDEGSSITPYVAGGIGLVIAMLIYFMVFINGMMIMRSVMEEKVNRIVEIMISTVRPFELMLGKLIGVGAVGVTQIFIWLTLIPIILFGITLLFGETMTAGAQGMGEAPQIDEATLMGVLSELANFNWWVISIAFIFYYLGGFLLYSSLFGALGAMMGDDLGENNSLSLIITIPIVIAIYIGVVAVQSPNSTLAVWSSIFPLFSPIVMPCRLAFDPPLWQLLLSGVLLIAFTLFIVWFSGKIYRVGILMYGKKADLREVIKWLRNK
nr:ABC transporter permease [Saprospiraceae bacterium]